ncbi:MAG: TIGR03960 family B12-binding radical SAM protein [Clostridiales Family XIII bacterium]|jgi:radical SAM family uncharacterized protein|nr:TIGR03960 family B12-binding radical SAM protein [Clostridiales Family XIII bacterium]
MNDPLTEKDCYRLFAEYGTMPHIIRHCAAVSRASYLIASELRAAGLGIDPALAGRAGLLHDMVRTEANHAERAAEIVARYDAAAADIIRVHMHYDLAKDAASMTETDVVALADRSVLEDSYVGHRKRIEFMIQRFSDNPGAVNILREKLAETSGLVASIESLLGKPMGEAARGDAVDVDRLLRRVVKPGRYIGGEVNSARKNLSFVTTRVAFCFPDLYEIGMSYTGLQIIYGLLNSMEGVCCERAFAPAADMEALMREEGIPLFTLETHSPASHADLVAFTLQYELSYTNILNMIDLAGIPPLSSGRAEGDPFVCAGGSCACNPEPLADAFDFIVIGDGEDIFPVICGLHSKWKNNGGARREFLEAIARVEGVYVPLFYEPIYDGSGKYLRHDKKLDCLPDRIRKRSVDDLDNAYYPLSPIIPVVEAVHERAVCEISRGCGRGCRFCQAGHIYRPVRKRTPERVRGIIDAQLTGTGYDEVSLLSLSVGDYPGIEPLVAGLMDDLKKRDVSLSLPSLRLDTVSPDMLARIASYKKSSLTFAPEAGTQRLRDAIRKNITEDDILAGVEKAVSIGWNRVKLYFMIGLPTETREDLDGIVSLAETIMQRARELRGKEGRGFGITVSVSNFAPKPHTPFQWARGNDEETLKEKMFYLKDRLRSVKGVNFRFHDTRVSAVEMMLSKGDRRTFAAIRRAWELGCRFDSWREHFKWELWARAFEETGARIGEDPYTDSGAPLPWDIVDTGLGKDMLLREYEKTLNFGENNIPASAPAAAERDDE